MLGSLGLLFYGMHKYKKVVDKWLVNHFFTRNQINSEEVFGETPLVRACRRGDNARVDFLLNHLFIDPNKASIEKTSKKQITPLCWAVVQENFKMTTRLLGHFLIDPNKASDGQPPLIIAIQKKNIPIICALLDHIGIRPETTDSENRNACDYIKSCLIEDKGIKSADLINPTILRFIKTFLVKYKGITSTDLKTIQKKIRRHYDLLFYGFLRQQYGIKKRQEAPLLIYIIYQTGHPLHSLVRH